VPYSTRLPLTDNPVIDLHQPPQLAVNLETITYVRYSVQAVEEYRPAVKPDGVASGAIAAFADVE
jgi:hypothetical protein